MADLLRLTGQVEIQAAADGTKPPRVAILAYTGGTMSVGGWGRVAIDLAGLDASGQIPLLVDHDASLEGIVGHGSAEISNGQLTVVGAIPPVNDAARQVVERAKAGFAWQASVGVEPTRRERIEAGGAVAVNGKNIQADAMGLTLIRAGKLKEVSIVALGADGATSVRVAAQKGKRMTETTNTVEIPEELKAAWDKQGLTDDERVEARLAAFRREHGDVLPEFGRGMVRAAASGALPWADAEREILRAEVRALQLKAIRAERPAGPSIRSGQKDATGPDMLQASLLVHLGAEDVAAKAFGDRVTQSARDARMGSLVEILQAAWRDLGQDAPTNRNDLIKASFSTAAISNIVSGAQNKILLDQWQRLPLTCLQLCKRVSASDFKEGKAIRLIGRDTMMDEVGPAGQIKHGHLQDSAATYKLATYARMYAVTRQDIINDDLGAFDELPRIIARGAGLKMESVFWTLVLANAGSFFGEGNGNILVAPLDMGGLAEAVTKMRNLTDADGEPVLCEPRTLVVSPVLEPTADRLYASNTVAVVGPSDTVTTVPAASSFGGKYKPLVSPYISNTKYPGNSASQWYLWGDPNAGPAAFIAAFLDGVQNPTIEQSDTDFNTLGVQFRGFLDFAFAQCDPQGATKSTGAG